jgi:hypothetical protein
MLEGKHHAQKRCNNARAAVKHGLVRRDDPWNRCKNAKRRKD